MSNWNDSIIADFRENDGKVGGMFAGAPLLLLHTTGAKSGTARVSPLMYRPVGDGYAIFASKAGAPTNPDWFYNLRAHPRTSVEVGTSTVAVTAREAEGSERDEIFAAQAAEWPHFAEYQAKTDRLIPVVVLEPSE